MLICYFETVFCFKKLLVYVADSCHRLTPPVDHPFAWQLHERIWPELQPLPGLQDRIPDQVTQYTHCGQQNNAHAISGSLSGAEGTGCR